MTFESQSQSHWVAGKIIVLILRSSVSSSSSGVNAYKQNVPCPCHLSRSMHLKVVISRILQQIIKTQNKENPTLWVFFSFKITILKKLKNFDNFDCFLFFINYPRFKSPINPSGLHYAFILTIDIAAILPRILQSEQQINNQSIVTVELQRYLSLI